MSALSGHVEDYLRLRRALGYKLERAGHLLPKLVAYLEAAGSPTLTSELAISWARLPAQARLDHPGFDGDSMFWFPMGCLMLLSA
jgi:hypothetical protein